MSEEIRPAAEPSADPRSGSIVPSIPHDLMHATPDRILPRWFWIMLGGAVLAVVIIGLARAAEPVAEPHVISLYWAGKDYDRVSRMHITLGSKGKDAEYESEDACNKAIARVRVELKGVRLKCDPVETRRVQ